MRMPWALVTIRSGSTATKPVRTVSMSSPTRTQRSETVACLTRSAACGSSGSAGGSGGGGAAVAAVAAVAATVGLSASFGLTVSFTRSGLAALSGCVAAGVVELATGVGLSAWPPMKKNAPAPAPRTPKPTRQNSATATIMPTPRPRRFRTGGGGSPGGPAGFGAAVEVDFAGVDFLPDTSFPTGIGAAGGVSAGVWELPRHLGQRTVVPGGTGLELFSASRQTGQVIAVEDMKRSLTGTVSRRGSHWCQRTCRPGGGARKNQPTRSPGRARRKKVRRNPTPYANI